MLLAACSSTQRGHGGFRWEAVEHRQAVLAGSLSVVSAG